MKYPSKFNFNRRLITTFLVAIGFVGPLLATGRSASATEGELDSDARLVGYGTHTTVLDTGTAPDYLLIGALTILGCSVMFKDAKRSHKKS